MTLFQDMLPDAKWEKHEKDGTGYVGLSLPRARQLHAAISIRNYGVWSLILTAWGMATKLDDRFDLTVSLGFSTVAVAFFCIYLVASFLDRERNRDVNSRFPVSFPTPRHSLEAIAIPALFSGFIGFMVLVFSLNALEIQSATGLYAPLVWFIWIMANMPWMGITALVMCFGAWLRWCETSSEGLGGQVEIL